MALKKRKGVSDTALEKRLDQKKEGRKRNLGAWKVRRLEARTQAVEGG
jgi:ribosomal protein L19E